MEDVPAIMKFIGENWKKDHILARDEAFFCWMYVDEKGCNVVLAVDEENTIYGMLAVIKYNSTDQPVSGSRVRSALLSTRLLRLSR